MVRKVAIVGGGVVGLTTAVVIAENLKDVQVTVISDKWSPETTGDGSAGFLTPYLLGDMPVQTLREWCQKSFEIFQEIFQSELAVECGLGLFPVYWLYHIGPAEEPVYKDLFIDYRPMTQKELSIFPSRFRHGVAMTTFFIECTKFLPVLMKRIQKKGGRFIEKKIHNFSELAGSYDVVINCTGLGSRNLVPDPEVTPIRGQVMKKNWARLKGGPYRPTPRIERESIKTKKGNLEVIHNYGHGGCGVMLSWGCAYHVLGLLREVLEHPYSNEKQTSPSYSRSKI
ncbi:D-aspartate oxidase like protein [Argiope bruennichi]|uniref:D-aspartate oxidase like protein n=1 Tax=Argiope bruennichi TaxID=94029 RepID=A0A8T0E9P3_ARGBR|nr:D-aspartate oxidase like protein [Argiope bruennichi]